MFLKSIRSETYMAGIDDAQRAEIEQYLYDMKTGPADSEMDIEWQETGRGYYRHLLELENCADEQERAVYRERLEEDARLWLEEAPGNYMVRSAREILETRR